MEKKTDLVEPSGRWTFDADVTAAFDDMLERSIPQYSLMRDEVHRLAVKNVVRGTDVVDLGCARGEALAPLIEKFGAYNRWHAIDASEPMLEVCRERFKGYTATEVMSVRKLDLRSEYPAVRASVTLAVLTLMFIPVERRPALIRKIFESTIPGGVLIVVEKVIGRYPFAELLEERYRELKSENGYSADSIERKRLALEGVLVPLGDVWNEELLRSAGFDVQPFWRWFNFVGWIARRPG